MLFQNILTWIKGQTPKREADRYSTHRANIERIWHRRVAKAKEDQDVPLLGQLEREQEDMNRN